MENEGKAISLVTNEQMELLHDIEFFMQKRIQQLSFDKGRSDRSKQSKSNKATSFNQNKKKIPIAMPTSD